MAEKITLSEIKELLQEHNVQPQAIFTKEALLSDPTVVLSIEKAVAEGKSSVRDELKLSEEEKKKVEEKKKGINDLIPDDKPGKTVPDDNELIPDVDEKGEPGEDNDLIPD